MFHRTSTRRLAVETLEDRKMLTCSVADGIALDDGVLCIDGTQFEDYVTVDLEFHPTQEDDLAPIGGGAAPNPPIGGGAGGDAWIVRARMVYDPGPSIYDDPFDNDTEVSVVFEAAFDDVDKIEFVGGGGNSTDMFWNNTSIPSEAWGGGGDDYFFGGSATDSFHGGDGEDELFGYGGVDYLRGEDGNDDLYGGSGTDFLYGGEDYDDLYGGDGADYLYGQDGPDTLNGGDDNYVDFLQGGGDSDIFTAEVHWVAIDGDTYMINYDTFDDCIYGDAVSNVSDNAANAFCDGEALELTILYAGPANKTTEPENPYDAIAELDLSGKEKGFVVDGATSAVYEVALVGAVSQDALTAKAVAANSAKDAARREGVDRVLAEDAADSILLEFDVDLLADSLAKALAADVTRRR